MEIDFLGDLEKALAKRDQHLSSLHWAIWPYINAYDDKYGTNIRNLVETLTFKRGDKLVWQKDGYSAYRVCFYFIMKNNLINKSEEEIITLWKLTND